MDSHVCAVLEEAMAANAHSAIFAFQYNELVKETQVARMARLFPNLSVYARDSAIIDGVDGRWRPGQPPTDEWEEIRQTFWKDTEGGGEFLLGDFAQLARFLELTKIDRLETQNNSVLAEAEVKDVVPPAQEV